MLKSIDIMKLLYTIAAATEASARYLTFRQQYEPYNGNNTSQYFQYLRGMLRKGVADYLGPVTCSEEDHKDDQTFPSWMKCVLSFKIRARSLP